MIADKISFVYAFGFLMTSLLAIYLYFKFKKEK